MIVLQRGEIEVKPVTRSPRKRLLGGERAQGSLRTLLLSSCFLCSGKPLGNQSRAEFGARPVGIPTRDTEPVSSLGKGCELLPGGLVDQGEQTLDLLVVCRFHGLC